MWDPFTEKYERIWQGPHQFSSFLQHLLINSKLWIVLLLFAHFSFMHEFEIFEPIGYNAIVHTCFIAKLAHPKISHFPFIYVPNQLSIQDIPQRINEWMSLNQPRQNTNDYYHQLFSMINPFSFFVSHLAKITKLLYGKIEWAIKNCSILLWSMFCLSF